MIVRIFPALLFGAFAIAGCGGGNNSSAVGTVTLDGQPLTTGAVTFHPVSPGPLAIGNIGSDGAYSVNTADQAGLSPGDYQVTVVATGPAPEPTPQDPMPLPKLLTPARYGDVNTSGLKYTINRGENRIDIVLKTE